MLANFFYTFMILFDSVTKRFGKHTVLEDFQLQIKSGEFISLVGPSGAGKTTIIKLLLGAEQPTEGRICVNNRDMRTLDAKTLQQYRRNIGVVFQDYKLISDKTIFENVAFPLESCGFRLADIVSIVPTALQLLGIEHIQDRFPEQLSGGEAQRAALARAMVHRPKLLLADEPTGNLDIENVRNVLKNLIKINLSGTTVVLTTHNKPLVEMIGQKVVYLKPF